MAASHPSAARPEGPAAPLGAEDNELVGGPKDLAVAPVAAVGERASGELLTIRWAEDVGQEAERPGGGSRGVADAAWPAGSGRGGPRPSTRGRSSGGSLAAQTSPCTGPIRSVILASSSASIRGSEGGPSGFREPPGVAEDILFVERLGKRGKYFSGSLKNRREAGVDLLHRPMGPPADLRNGTTARDTAFASSSRHGDQRG